MPGSGLARKPIARSALIIAVIAVALVGTDPASPPAAADGGVVLDISLTKPATTPVASRFISTQWDFNRYWTDKADAQPDYYFAKNYPQIKTIQFMTATGGCYVGYPGCTSDRDLFIDPSDRSTMTDYDFSPLIGAVGNVLRQGLVPFIKTGNVPIKFTAEPKISAEYDVNMRPPDDYDVYAAYIKALGDALVAEFGIDTVKTFTWGVLTEAAHPFWFEAADGNLETTKAEYLNLYDYTVKALQDSIGAKNLTVGMHVFSLLSEPWIDHCVGGVNAATGGIGTQCNYIADTFYHPTPEAPAPDFHALVDWKAYAAARGLDLKVGIDEGEFLYGRDGKDLTSRTSGTTSAGSYEALLFMTLNDQEIDWHTKWSLSTRGNWGGAMGPVRSVDTNVDILASKMLGDARLELTASGEPASPTDIVDGMATYDAVDSTVRVLAFNHNPDSASTVAESPTIRISDIVKNPGSAVEVTTWYVDDDHAQFWNAWTADAEAYGIGADQHSWSSDSTSLPGNLTTSAARKFYESNESRYAQLSRLTSVTEEVTLDGTVLTLTPKLEHHAVVMYEIKNVSARAAALADGLSDWGSVETHTDGLRFESGEASALGDPSRVVRTTDGTSPEYIDYRASNVEKMTVTALAKEGGGGVGDLTFSSSPDGVVWSDLAVGTVVDSRLADDLWLQRVYDVPDLPQYISFVRIGFPGSVDSQVQPQLSKVELRFLPSAAGLFARKG